MASEERRPLLSRSIPEIHPPRQWDTLSDRVPAASSRENLVEGFHPGKKLPQYVAAISAAISAIAAGSIIGWSSSAGPRITDGNEYGFIITKSDNAWVGSLTTLGAACICYPTGFIMDRLGRKLTMLIFVIPFTLGWFLIIFAVNLPMLLIGRFIIGISGGTYCVTVPAYISEIAQDDIRGALGTLFQLMVTVGVLFAFAIGSYFKVLILNIMCTLIPLVFGIIFVFMPESPYYLIYCNHTEEANIALRRLRGLDYDISSEFNKIMEKVVANRENPTTFRQKFSQIAAKKALIICVFLMMLQQFSGINAVLFNTTDIFIKSCTNVAPEISTIIIGVIQVVATLLSTIVIDKLGRRILLLFSSVTMGICTVLLGVYFYLLNVKDPDKDLLGHLSWLPLVSLCVYITAFSLGLGPIPWLVSGELCTPNIKAFVSASGGTINWFFAFIITKYFEEMKSGLGEGGTFWFFSAFTFAGLLFIYFVMPETKGKSVNDIQRILNGESLDSETSI